MCRKGTHAKEMTNAVSRKEAGVIKKASGSEVVITIGKNGYRESTKKILDLGNI